MATRPAPVTSLSETRVLKAADAVDQARRKLREAEARLADECRRLAREQGCLANPDPMRVVNGLRAAGSNL